MPHGGHYWEAQHVRIGPKLSLLKPCGYVKEALSLSGSCSQHIPSSLVPRLSPSFPSLAVRTASNRKLGEGLGMRLYTITVQKNIILLLPAAAMNGFNA